MSTPCGAPLLLTTSVVLLTFPTAGAYDEEELLDLIAHVEADCHGKPATIIGTKKAVRNLAPSIQGTDSKSDLYNLGYYGQVLRHSGCRDSAASQDWFLPSLRSQMIC